jgi:hypothetical protein
VVKRFAVTTPEGVHGFSVGKMVAIVRKEAGGYTVTDGKAQGFAPMGSFTNNLDVADAATEEATKSAQAAMATPAPAMVQQAATQKPDTEPPIKKPKQVSEMEEAARALSVRIFRAQIERGDKGYPRSGGPLINPNTQNITPLGDDAENIEKLIATRDELATRIKAAMNNP